MTGISDSPREKRNESTPDACTFSSLLIRAKARVMEQVVQRPVGMHMARPTLDTLAIEHTGRAADGDAWMFGLPIYLDPTMPEGSVDIEHPDGRRERILRLTGADDDE